MNTHGILPHYPQPAAWPRWKRALAWGFVLVFWAFLGACLVARCSGGIPG